MVNGALPQSKTQEMADNVEGEAGTGGAGGRRLSSHVPASSSRATSGSSRSSQDIIRRNVIPD